MSYQVTAK